MNDHFYKPGDDTYLLIDTINNYKSELYNLPTFIEIGCGSGTITKYLTETFKNSLIISSDINIHALKETSKYNHNLIKMSLLEGINQKMVNVVVFNPPYVETLNSETGNDDIRAAYSGGIKGRLIIDRFVEELKYVEIVFLLVIRKNEPQEVITNLARNGYYAEIVNNKKIMGETLYVIKANLIKEGK